MKWTQQQRAQAVRDTEAMCMASDRATAVESYNDAAIELACQRNELLEALKLLTADNANRGTAGAEVNWPAIHLAQAAIAKAEGK